MFHKRLMNKVPVRYAKAADSLVAAIRMQGADVEAGFRERVAAVLHEGEEAPDILHVMDVVARVLVHESRRLIDVDEAATLGGMNVSLSQRQCRQVKAEVREVVIELRRQMRAVYGAEESSELLSIVGRTPRSLEDLDDLAQHLLRVLPHLALPPKAGLKIDRTAWVHRLRAPAERLHQARVALMGGCWAEQDAQRAKKLTLQSFQGTYSLAVRFFETLFHLSGRPFLGQRLRPGAVKVLRGGRSNAEAAESLDRDRRRWPLSLSRWLRKLDPGASDTRRGPTNVA